MTVPETKPWYRHPMVWVVLAPPVLSVIAGMYALSLILTHPDADVRIAHPAKAVIHGHRANSLIPPAD
jgi:hypothetical protein